AAAVAAAPLAIHTVAKWILAVEVLVILLGAVKGRGGQDRRNDGVGHLQVLGGLALGFLGKPLLLFVVIEDRRAVLRTPVEKLPRRIGRVDVVPEHVE